MFKKIKHLYIFTVAIIFLSSIALFVSINNLRSGIKIIDTHEHIQSVNKADILKIANDKTGVEKTVLLASPIETIKLNGNKSFTDYRNNVDEILRITKKYPDSFVPLCTLSPLDEDAVEYFKSCIKKGVKGLKLYNGHSYYYDVFKLPLDTPKMMEIYAIAEANHIPILYHINITKYGDELENILKEYPNLVISVPHFMVSSIKIEKTKRLLDLYPNLYTDISFGSTPFFAAGFRRISNNPQKYIDFINEYSDRILFGTDMVLSDVDFKNQKFMENTINCYRDILEKKTFKCNRVNEYYKKEADKNTFQFENCNPETQDNCDTKKEKMESYTRWYKETKKLNGLDLKEEMLQKIYQDNPLRFLSANQS